MKTSLRFTKLVAAGGSVERVQPDQDRPLDETHRLNLEVERLTAENVALRKAADIWIRMYEGLLARAASR